MNLRKTTTAAFVAASLTLSTVAPATAGGVPVAPTSSGSDNSAEIALGALLIIGLFAWVTTGSAKSKASSGATVTRNGGKTTGGFTVLKF